MPLATIDIFFRFVFPAVGSILVLVMSFAPIKSIKAAEKAGDLGSLNPIPACMLLCNCAIWAMYSMAIRDYFVFMGSAPGCLVNLYVVMKAHSIANRPTRDLMDKTLLGSAVVLLIVILQYIFVPVRDTAIHVHGNMAMVVNIIMFAAPLSSLKTVIQTRNSSSILLPLTIASLACSALWCTYGFAVGQMPIIVPNASGVVLNLFQFGLRAVYPAKPETLPHSHSDMYDRQSSTASTNSREGLKDDMPTSSVFVKEKHLVKAVDGLPASVEITEIKKPVSFACETSLAMTTPVDLVFKFVFPTVGSILVLVMSVTPLRAVREARKAGDLGTLNPIPPCVLLCNCSVWVLYSLALKDDFVFMGNAPSVLVNAYVVLVAHSLARRDTQEVMDKTLLGSCTLLLAIVWLYVFIPEKATALYIHGVLATVVNIAMYASPLSTLKAVIQTRNSSSIFLPFTAAALVCSALWTVYGLADHQLPIVIPNACGVVLNLFQFALRAIYPSRIGNTASASSSSTCVQMVHRQLSQEGLTTDTPNSTSHSSSSSSSGGSGGGGVGRSVRGTHKPLAATDGLSMPCDADGECIPVSMA